MIEKIRLGIVNQVQGIIYKNYTNKVVERSYKYFVKVR